ncbi:MAG: hypothetical protein ACKV2T_29640, partial [Kofleriaceae bacterium]
RVVAIDTHERKLIAGIRAANHDQPPRVVNDAVDAAIANFHERLFAELADRGTPSSGADMEGQVS